MSGRISITNILLVINVVCIYFICITNMDILFNLIWFIVMYVIYAYVYTHFHIRIYVCIYIHIHIYTFSHTYVCENGYKSRTMKLLYTLDRGD